MHCSSSQNSRAESTFTPYSRVHAFDPSPSTHNPSAPKRAAYGAVVIRDIFATPPGAAPGRLFNKGRDRARRPPTHAACDSKSLRVWRTKTDASRGVSHALSSTSGSQDHGGAVTHFYFAKSRFPDAVAYPPFRRSTFGFINGETPIVKTRAIDAVC